MKGGSKMAEAFTFLTDSNDIPVCAYQIGANALSQVLFVPVKVTDEVQTTDGSGFFQCDHYPVLDIDGDGALTAADVLPRNNGSGVVLYVGTAAADLDSNAGKFKLYSDAGLTTAVTATACKCTYYYAVPVSVDSSGALVLGAGTAIMGKVGIDQTTPGTTNGVQINAAIPAGDNNIGNVDIVTLPSGNLGQQAKAASLSVAPATDITDATYIGDIKFGESLPAGSNNIGDIDVASLPALIAGSAIIGQVGIDQTTPGTTNGVQVNAALPAGTNLLGKFGIDQTTPGTTNQVSTELPDAATLADGAANPTAPMVGANEQLYNGTTWDRKRNNLQGALLASAARTETQTGTDQVNYNGRGIHVVLDVTAVTDTPSIVLKIEGKSASGVYYTLLEGAAVTGTGTHVYKVMPWATPVANEAAADLLPRTWRVVVTHADADSITYSVDYAIDC
jgi:hypothetical protein